MRKEEHGRSVISTYIPGHFRLRVGGSAANFCIRLACRKVGKIRGENGKTETRLTISCIPFALLAPSSSPCPLSFPPTSFHPSPWGSSLFRALFFSDISSILTSFFLPFDSPLLPSAVVAIKTKIWGCLHHHEPGKTPPGQYAWEN